MSETTMPVAEAAGVSLQDERNAYELAFHILPTVAEGEVPSVFESIKSLITKDKGEIFDEETPERFELAYEIVKHMEGKNRKFTSAYFGWARFRSEASSITTLLEEIDSKPEVLRHLLIKLTRIEEENPFRFHSSLASTKKVVTTIDEAELVSAAAGEIEVVPEEETMKEVVDIPEGEKESTEGVEVK